MPRVKIKFMMLNIVMLNVIILSDVMLVSVILSVAASLALDLIFTEVLLKGKAQNS